MPVTMTIVILRESSSQSSLMSQAVGTTWWAAAIERKGINRACPQIVPKVAFDPKEVSVVAGRKLFDLRRSLTEVYQDIVDTFGGVTGGTTAVVPPVTRSISRTIMSR